MKTKYILMAGLAALAMFSCSRDDLAPEPEREPLPPARIVSVSHDDTYGMTVCSIEYPSVDPEGNPVTLSALITYGDEISELCPAQGIILMSRFTAFGLADTPSGGYLICQEALVGSGLVCISPDLYGFGATKDKLQAYCMGFTNAQASIDALLAAQELIQGMDLPFEPGKDNRIFNLGYSQGGQTAIGVLKLASEKYPDLHFAHTFAGSGPYDMLETFNFMIDGEESHYPPTVLLALIAYNEYYHLGYTLSDLFLPSAIPVIEQYILSKDYRRSQVIEQFPVQPLESWIKADLLKPDTEIFQRFKAAFAKENLCTGWVPSKEGKIYLFSSPEDEVVAPANTRNLYQFLVYGRDLSQVEWVHTSGVSILVPGSVLRHIAAVADFILQFADILKKDYDIAWLPNLSQIVEDELAKMGKE